MKKNVLIIGAGGVAQTAAHKCAQHNDVLGDLHIASLNIEKCHQLIDSIREKKSAKVDNLIQAHQLDASDVAATQALIRATHSEIVMNLGPSFVNMDILEACILEGVAYLDTSIHEDPKYICETPPWYANYEWKRKERCAQNKITAILGAGFDPGMVNAYAALAVNDYFDEVESIDIIDVNAGNHGHYFATNFNPEINFREFTGNVWSWQNNDWAKNSTFEVSREDDLPEVGQIKTYLTGHDELHSLSQILKVPNIRFWMSFSDHYINVFTVLNKIGLLSEKPVTLHNGEEIVPLKLIKALLPDPISLAPNYTGKTCIGDMVKGKKSGQDKSVFIYNVADHQASYQEVGAQAISYTAGVPAAAAAILIAKGIWDVEKMANIEELPVKPFLHLLNHMGLPTRIKDESGDRFLTFNDNVMTVS